MYNEQFDKQIQEDFRSQRIIYIMFLQWKHLYTLPSSFDILLPVSFLYLKINAIPDDPFNSGVVSFILYLLHHVYFFKHLLQFKFYIYLIAWLFIFCLFFYNVILKRARIVSALPEVPHCVWIFSCHSLNNEWIDGWIRWMLNKWEKCHGAGLNQDSS